MTDLKEFFERKAEELRVIDRAQNDRSCYVCMSECLEEAISLLFAAMFPRHFGVPEACCGAGKRQKDALQLCYDALARLLAYVEATRDDGIITLRADSPLLDGAEITIPIKCF